MADFTQSKQVFIQQAIATARQMLQLADNLDALNAAFSVHGFNSGAANQFVDADFTGDNSHITAAMMFDAMFAIGTIDTDETTGIRNSLREIIPGGTL